MVVELLNKVREYYGIEVMKMVVLMLKRGNINGAIV